MQIDALDPIRNAIRKEQYLKLAALILLLLLGCALVYHFFSDNLIMTIIGLVLLLCAIYNGRKLLMHWKVSHHRLLRYIYFEPQRIVWVYPMLISRMPFGLQFSKDSMLYFKLHDGDEITVGIAEEELPALLKALQEKLPGATFGHSKDKEQWYLADPELLRQ